MESPMEEGNVENIGLSSQRSKPCVFCLLNVSKYTCPRCKAVYCSVSCYRSEKHLQCSESFYKNCVTEGLVDLAVSQSEREKMIEILKKASEADDDDYEDSDEEGCSLADRLTGLDLDKDTDKIWDVLTKQEKEEFQKLLRDEQLGGLIEFWSPWWSHKETSKVEDLDADMKPDKAFPQLYKDIPHISQILKNSKPSSDLRFTVISTVYSYAYICRLHNGDHLNTPLDCANEVLLLCDVLDTTQNYSSTTEALHACLNKSNEDSSSIQASQKFSISIIKDIINIIEGPCTQKPLHYLLMALSDLLKMFQRAQKEISKDLKKEKSSNETLISQLKTQRKKLFRSEKKILFLLSWAQSYGLALRGCLQELNLEFCELSSELASVTNTKKQFENEWKGKRPPTKKPLIEVLN
ncbi:zinc finger HIT domain-containing protein 2 [Octopus sinensis]|uniref:Zinc finger HIT domain-containing protein 2 n=1 Tax=Octopus sinensis TaxID=2607531 RepID=A0A6P7TAW0_9MOLL|nr:zinc finger HIT domain-containing protein 2 [Octopus sinensis]